MRQFQGNKALMGTKESKKIIKMYNQTARALVEFETLWHQAWCRSIEESKAGLQASLVVRNPRTGKLFVNFDHEVCMHVSVCIDICMYGDIYVYAYTYIYMYGSAGNLFMVLYTYIHAYIHKYVHTSKQA